MTTPARRASVTLVCGTLIIAIVLGIRHAFGVFLRPVTIDLSLTRETFALAIAMQNLIWGLAQPFAGMVADKFGGGPVIGIGGLIFVAGLLFATVSTDSTGFYISVGLLVGLGLSATSYAVVLGAIGRAVAPERRSLALGIATAGGSFGMFVVVPGSQLLISGYGWIAALTILAITAALVPWLATVFARSEQRPEAMLSTQSLSGALLEARQHSGYWLLNAGFFVCGFQTVFIATHLPSFLADQAISPMVAAVSLALIGFFNMIGTYLWGLFGDRYRKKYLLSVLYLARAIVIALFIYVPVSSVSAVVFGAAVGLLWLGTVPLTSGLVAQIFGLRYLATLVGIVFLSHQVGSFLGGWLGGYVFDVTGSYDLVWLASIALGVAAAILHWPIADAPLEHARAKLPAEAT
ncbi:MAG: MFS transporter [Acidiferrobacterales bacterium]